MPSNKGCRSRPRWVEMEVVDDDDEEALLMFGGWRRWGGEGKMW